MQKITILILLLIVVSFGKINAQSIGYQYDANGNRVKRHVIYLKKSQPNNSADSTNNNDNQEFSDIINDLRNDNLITNEIKIYPNPTNGNLQVDITNMETEQIVKIQLFDINGRQLHNNEEGTPSNQIDISDKSPGIYIMIILIDGKKSEWKIIKD